MQGYDTCRQADLSPALLLLRSFTSEKKLPRSGYAKAMQACSDSGLETLNKNVIARAQMLILDYTG